MHGLFCLNEEGFVTWQDQSFVNARDSTGH